MSAPKIADAPRTHARSLAVDAKPASTRPHRSVEADVQLARAIAGAKMRLHGTAASDRALRVVSGPLSSAESQGVTGPLVTADPVAAELEAALEMRRTGADAKALRRALRQIEELLDEVGEFGAFGPPTEPIRNLRGPRGGR